MSALKILKIIYKTGKGYTTCLCCCPICNRQYILRYSTALRSKYGCHDCYLKKLRENAFYSKHQMSKTKIYKCWLDMKARCYNPKKFQFNDWGGRGISVCDEWKNDFMSFYNWAKNNGYKEGLTIDRIDVNEGYFPNNCRWVSRHIQSSNRRRFINNTSGFVGICYRKDSGKWRARIDINGIAYNIGTFNTVKEAVIARDKFIIENNLVEYQTQILKKDS